MILNDNFIQKGVEKKNQVNNKKCTKKKNTTIKPDIETKTTLKRFTM